MLSVLMLGAVFEVSDIGHGPMACTFPAQSDTAGTIRIMVDAKPSLKDLPGLYKAGLSLDGSRWLSARAQPIASTEVQDVMVRAKEGAARYVTLGVDAMGRAALNIALSSDTGGVVQEFSRSGYCTNHERYIDRWTKI